MGRRGGAEEGRRGCEGEEGEGDCDEEDGALGGGEARLTWGCVLLWK